jgi:hypothetical protein
MSSWNTIHIYGYGESQIISNDANRKVANDKLSTISPLLSFLATKQQEGTSVNIENLHTLNIANGTFIDFVPLFGNNNKMQRYLWNDVDITLIDNIADEIDRNAPNNENTKVPKSLLIH